MAWVAVAAAGIGAAGSIISSKANKKAVNSSNEADGVNYAKYLRSASPNYTTTSGATSKWAVDPTTGERTQTMAFGPEEQKRRDMYNQAAGNRAQIGAGFDLSRFNQGPTFANNPRLQQSQMNAGGPRQPNAPTSPYQLTPRPVAPIAPAPAPAPAPVAAPSGLENLTPQEIQQLLLLLRSDNGGGNSNGGG